MHCSWRINDTVLLKKDSQSPNYPCRGRVEKKNFKRQGLLGFYTTLYSVIHWRSNKQICMASNSNRLVPMGSF
jgi:hypothetical protein